MTSSKFTLSVKLHSRAESRGDDAMDKYEKDVIPWNQPYIPMTYTANNRAALTPPTCPTRVTPMSVKRVNTSVLKFTEK